MDVSGPSIQGRLTSAANFYQVEAENVGTVRATLPDGSIFALGITRPTTYRDFQSTHTLQLADAHSLRGFGRIATEESRDQGIGNFTLPERASNWSYRQINTGVRPFSALSSKTLLEGRVIWNTSRSTTTPINDALRINVLDAFNSGGAQNRSSEESGVLEFGNLYTRIGEVVTLKSGIEGNYRLRRTVNTSNFGGTFTFSNLESYLAGTPLTYRVNRGEPRPRTEPAGSGKLRPGRREDRLAADPADRRPLRGAAEPRGLQQPGAARVAGVLAVAGNRGADRGGHLLQSTDQRDRRDPAAIRWLAPVRNRHRQSDVSRSVRRRHDPPDPAVGPRHRFRSRGTGTRRSAWCHSSARCSPTC